MEFRILGPLQVLDEGRILPLGGAKQRSTLAMLLLGRNQIVSRDRLIDGLWGASPPPTAGPTLETYVSRLRRVLPGDGEGARLVTQPPGYRLRVKAGELDLERFETLLEQARAARSAGDFERARTALRDALSLFRGAPLEDLVHAPFTQAEIGRLEELRLVALEQRLDADLAVGRHSEVVGELESLVARHPFREVLWGQLMLALYRSGRQGEALLAFDRARRTLAEELGVDPSTPLKQLHLQVLQQDPSLEISTESADAAAVAALTPAPSGLSTGRSGAPSSALRQAPRPIVAAPPTPLPRHADRAFPRGVRLGRRVLIVGAVLAVAVTLAAIFIPRLEGEGGSDSTLAARPGTALIDLRNGKVITSIPLSRLAVSAYPLFADGHFWVHNFEPNSYVQIDPKTGAIGRQVNPPARPVEGSAESETLTPFAVQGNTLWVGSGHDLVRMDIDRGRVVERFRLDDSVGGGSGLAEGVAVGGSSVWVSRDVGRGQIVRLDPTTGAVQHRFDDMNPYLQLAYGDGSLWAADESFSRAADERGIARIDAGRTRSRGRRASAETSG